MKFEASEQTVRSLRLSIKTALAFSAVACLLCPPVRAELQPDTAELQPAPELAPAASQAPVEQPQLRGPVNKPVPVQSGDSAEGAKKAAPAAAPPNSASLLPAEVTQKHKRRPWRVRFLDYGRSHEETLPAVPSAPNSRASGADAYPGVVPRHVPAPAELPEPAEEIVEEKPKEKSPSVPKAPKAPVDDHRPWGARYGDYTQSEEGLPAVTAPREEMEETRAVDMEKPEGEEDEESEIDRASRQSFGDERRRDIDPVPHYKKAVSLTQEKNYKEALEELEKALERNPSYNEAHYQVAFVNQLMGNTKVAIKEFKKYLRVKPEDVQAHINLGTLLKSNNDIVGAEAQYRKAIELHFYSFIAHYNLANLFVEQGLLADAQKEYKVCLKLKPNNAMVHNNMGVIYQRRNYLEEANEEFEKAARLEPNNPTFKTNISLVRQQIKKGKTM